MSEKTAIIKVDSLGKRYVIGKRGSKSPHLRHALANFVTAPFRNIRSIFQEPSEDELFWALRNVSFSVEPGEVVGVIGRNGAGKSTLLKLLSRITPPSEGEIRLRGRVASLLEVGTGFHPEFTGRENIYVNGAILGMRKKEIDDKFDEIVDFAGVEKFLDTPVKRYSSGMYVRLAFAVAAHLEPECLLVDEVLAVGDLSFQKKCLGKMQEVSRDEGRTVLFVSHNMAAVKDLCQRVLYIKDGQLAMDGTAADSISTYINESLVHYREGSLDQFRLYSYFPQAKFSSVNVLGTNRDGEGVPAISSGDDVTIELDVEVFEAVDDVKVTLEIGRATGERMAVVFSGDKEASFKLKPPMTKISCTLPKVPFTSGLYQAGISLNVTPGQARSIDYLKEYPIFSVTNVPQTHGQYADRRWGVMHIDEVKWEAKEQ